ncbi:MAG: MFS transporter [Anaerolineales bacterium]
MSFRFRLETVFRGALGWLLQTDRPVPMRSDGELAAEVERNYRWNFAVNLLDGASFWFGLSFISARTILPLFISKLTADPLPIGLVAVIAQGGWSLPQLFTANGVERLARKKPVVINLGFFLERLPVWVFVIAALIVNRTPVSALSLFLVSFAWFSLGAGMVATAWQDLIARCFPLERRGRFFGTTMFIGTGIGALGAVLSAWLLKTFPFPTNFVYIFAIAAASITLSWIFLALTREPVQPVSALRQSNRQFWATLPDILRRDHNFRRYLLARSLLALGGMGAGFITVAAVQRWQVPDSTVGAYTAVLLLGQTVGNLAFGWLADRFGHKLSLELGALASFLAFALAWLAPSAGWYYAVFGLSGIALGAMIVSGILVIMEFCEPQRLPTYAGLTNTGVGLVGMVAPLIGAWLASINYGWLFALSAGVNLCGLVAMRWFVQEPRWARSSKLISPPEIVES